MAAPERKTNYALAFGKAFAVLIVYAFLYTLATIMQRFAFQRGSGSLGGGIMTGFVTSMGPITMYTIHRNLAPDGWGDLYRFFRWAIPAGTTLWISYSLLHYKKTFEYEASKYAVSVAASATFLVWVFIAPNIIVARRRKYNLFNFREHKVIWYFIFPIGLITSVNIFYITVDPKVWIWASTSILIIFVFASISMIQLKMKDELGTVSGISLVAIYLTELLVEATSNIQFLVSGAAFQTIIVFLIAKLMFALTVMLLREITYTAKTIPKHSIYAPLFILQITEDLVISLLFINERLGWELAVTVFLITTSNLLRDCGFFQESWCRYVKKMTKDDRIALYMTREYFYNQQNIVAESVASPIVFVVILTEYLFADMASWTPFTEDQTTATREELLIIFSILISVRIPVGYLGWWLFMKRLKGLNRNLENWLPEISMEKPEAKSHSRIISSNMLEIDEKNIELVTCASPRAARQPSSINSSMFNGVKIDQKKKSVPTSADKLSTHVITPSMGTIKVQMNEAVVISKRARSTTVAQFFSSMELRGNKGVSRSTLAYWENHKLVLLLCAVFSITVALRHLQDEVEGPE